MKFFQPQVQSIRRTNWEEKDDFFLHAVTICDRTNFKSNGFEPLSDKLDENGVFQVNLVIIQDPTLPDHAYFTPVTHTIPLGKIPFEGNDGEVQVNMFVIELEASREGAEKPKESTTVSTTGADEEDRPLPPDEDDSCPVFPFK